MSIFSSLIPEAHPNHNVFDLSRRDVFSMKSAMLNVVFCQHTIPNAKYDITPVNQIEVSTMAKANFARMKQEIEYYFVPYSQIWRWFETFYYERQDTVRTPSDIKNMPLPRAVPCFDLHPVLYHLFQYYVYLRFYSILSSVVFERYSNIIEYDDIVPDFKSIFDGSFGERFAQVFPDSVLDEHDTVFFAHTYVDVHGRLCVEDSLRLFDMLGYGNYLPFFKSLYSSVMDVTAFQRRSMSVTFGDNGLRSFIIDFFDEVLPLPVRGPIKSSDLFDLVYDLFNINNGINLASIWNFADFDFPNPFLSVFPILSYLKVFSDNFRNTQYDTENYSFYYNLDSLVSPASPIFTTTILECLIPRYRLYRRDILTGTYPNAQFGDVAVASLQNPTLIKSMDGFRNSNVSVENGNLSVDAGNLPNRLLWSVDTGVSSLAIRQAEALQRYKEKNLRAGNKLINQQKAFFGDRSSYLSEDYSQFIFSCDSAVMINSVVATGESDGINLGDKGSKAESALNSKSFTFDSHDFGIILGIAYILPIAEYENYGIDPHLTKIENGDFFHPDLQNLGLSPVFSSLVNFFDPVTRTFPDIVTTGYSAHDWEYKTSLDRVHGEFNQLNGVFGDYVTPRDSRDFSAPLLASLYVSPNDVDSIFLEKADEFQSSDHFKVNMFHQVKAILPMSVTGLPY